MASNPNSPPRPLSPPPVPSLVSKVVIGVCTLLDPLVPKVINGVFTVLNALLMVTYGVILVVNIMYIVATLAFAPFTSLVFFFWVRFESLASALVVFVTVRRSVLFVRSPEQTNATQLLGREEDLFYLVIGCLATLQDFRHRLSQHPLWELNTGRICGWILMGLTFGKVIVFMVSDGYQIPNWIIFGMDWITLLLIVINYFATGVERQLNACELFLVKLMMGPMTKKKAVFALCLGVFLAYVIYRLMPDDFPGTKK